jgi:hypothetical protein
LGAATKYYIRSTTSAALAHEGPRYIPVPVTVPARRRKRRTRTRAKQLEAVVMDGVECAMYRFEAVVIALMSSMVVPEMA